MSSPGLLTTCPPQREALDGWAKEAADACGDTHIVDCIFGEFQKLDPYINIEFASVDTGQYECGNLTVEFKTDHSMIQTQEVFKRGTEGDPFVEPNEAGETSEQHYPHESATIDGICTRAQIAPYTGVNLHLSFRSHLFTVVIFGTGLGP